MAMTKMLFAGVVSVVCALATFAGEIAYTRTECGAGELGTRKRAVEKTLIFAERQIYWPGANVLHEWQDRHLYHDATLRPGVADLNGMQRGFLYDVDVLKDMGLDGFGAIAYHNVNTGHLKALEKYPKEGYVQMPIICPTDGGINLNEGIAEASGMSAAYNTEKKFILAHAQSPYAAKVNGKLLIWTYGGTEETNLAWAKMLRRDPDIPPFVMMGPMPFMEMYEGYGFCNATGRLESGKPNRIPEEKVQAYRNKVDEYAKAMGGFQVWCVNRRRDWNGEYPVITEATPIYREYIKPVCEEVTSKPDNRDVLVGAYLRQGYVNKYQGTTDGEYGTATLRAYLDEIVGLNPDVLMCFEWNEQNENTFFQPSVAHGKTWSRILNFYRHYLDRVTPQPMQGDDTSVPNLVISTRQSIKLGEKYHLELLYLPDGAKEKEVKVQVVLKDETGATLVTFPEETIPTDKLKAIDYRIASEQFAGHLSVTPELTVCYGDSCRRYENFDATRLTASVNKDFLYTQQPLREVLTPQSVKFEVIPANEPGVYRVEAEVKGSEPIRSLEIVDDLEEVAAADAANWFDNEKYALFRVELSALKPELLGNGADRWLKGVGNILNAHGDLRHTENMWETGGVNGPGRTGINLALGFGERKARFFIRVLRSELKGARFQLDLPRLGLHVADLAMIEKLGKYSWELGKTVRYTILRMDDLADIPAPLKANEARLVRTIRSACRMPALQLRVVGMDGRIYRSRLVHPILPEAAKERFNVFSETAKKPVTVELPSDLVPVFDYVFEPTYGQNLACGWETQYDAELGGGTVPGQPMALAALMGKLPKDFDGPAGARWVKEADGWELDFENGEYLNLPQETFPMAAEYTVDFEIMPRTNEDQVLWRSPNTHAPDEGLQVLMKGGTLHLSYYGIHFYKPLDFDSKAKLEYGKWNKIKLVRRYDKLECEVNGVKASFNWDRRSRHFTGMIFGACVKPNETAPAGIKPFSGRMRSLKIEHRVR